MTRNGRNQNRILVKLGEILRIVLGNKTIALFGLTIAILTLIVNVAPNEVRILLGLEKAPVSLINESPVSEYSLPLGDSKVALEYTIYEHQTQFVRNAQTSLSVIFQNLYGENFVSLNISPKGFESSVRAILNGYTEEFKSSTGVYNIQVLSIDYDSKKVVVQVSQKS